MAKYRFYAVSRGVEDSDEVVITSSWIAQGIPSDRGREGIVRPPVNMEMLIQADDLLTVLCAVLTDHIRYATRCCTPPISLAPTFSGLTERAGWMLYCSGNKKRLTFFFAFLVKVHQAGYPYLLIICLYRMKTVCLILFHNAVLQSIVYIWYIYTHTLIYIHLLTLRVL